MQMKEVYHCENMDGFERFDETLLPYTKQFYNNVTEYITDKNQKHAKKMMVKPETKRKYILPSGRVPKLSQQMH